MRRTNPPARWLHPDLACQSPLTLGQALRLSLVGLALGAGVCLLAAGLTRGMVPAGLMSLNPSVPPAAEPVAVREIPAPEPAASDAAAPQGAGQSQVSDQADPTPEAAPATQAAEADQQAEAYFDGRPLRKVETLEMEVTAYSPHAASTAPYTDGITASGKSVYTNAGRLVAADTDVLPMGTVVSVPGYHDGEPVQVLDVGGAIKGKRLDVLYPTHERALQWGRQHDVPVTVWEFAD